MLYSRTTFTKLALKQKQEWDVFQLKLRNLRWLNWRHFSLHFQGYRKEPTKNHVISCHSCPFLITGQYKPALSTGRCALERPGPSLHRVGEPLWQMHINDVQMYWTVDTVATQPHEGWRMYACDSWCWAMWVTTDEKNLWIQSTGVRLKVTTLAGVWRCCDIMEVGSFTTGWIVGGKKVSKPDSHYIWKLFPTSAENNLKIITWNKNLILSPTSWWSRHHMAAAGIMADAGPDDTTRLVTIFLGANDASLEEENPAQHVSWKLMLLIFAILTRLSQRIESCNLEERKRISWFSCISLQVFLHIPENETTFLRSLLKSTSPTSGRSLSSHVPWQSNLELEWIKLEPPSLKQV